jgi:peptidoglycan/LPS O-acetylase OafA/YrhL
MPPVPERSAFRADIEGLRGVAILFVVAFHAGVWWLAGGFIGVDVFFVLSGYLISGLLARELASSGDVDLTTFYARRAQRLLPALIVVLLATLAIALFFYAPIDQRPIASDARAVALHYGNVLFARNAVNYHASAENPFLHTWSLAVEEQFYIIWPLLFLVVARLWTGDQQEKQTVKRLVAMMLMAGAVSFVASLWITGTSQPWAFFGMPTRVWEFAIGGVAAVAVSKRELSGRVAGLLQGAALGAIVFSALAYSEVTPYPGIAATLPAVGTAALLVAGPWAPTSLVTRLLSNGVLRWFGRLSYSWYLWHWPLVGLGAVLDWNIGVLGRLGWSLLALVLAMLTYRFVETPFRETRRYHDRPHIAMTIGLGASAAMLLVAFFSMGVATRRAAAPAQRAIAFARNDGMKHDCWGSILENATAPCEFGDRSSRTVVFLMGDSHAEHWLPAVDRIGRQRGWKIIATIKPGCPVADVPELMNARLKRAYDECTSWRRATLRRIVAARPAAVILSTYNGYVATATDRSPWRVSPDSWREGLRRTYGVVTGAGISTVVLRDVPEAPFDAPSCLSRRAAGAPFARACVYDRSASLSPPAIAAQTEAVRGLSGIAIVDMTDRVCSTPRCSVVQRGRIVFRDGDHLTASFSRAEAPVLGERLVAALKSIATSN